MIKTPALVTSIIFKNDPLLQRIFSIRMSQSTFKMIIPWDEKFKKIQRHALNGELEKVKLLLSEFPVYKREDLKKMLILSASDRGLDLEI